MAAMALSMKDMMVSVQGRDDDREVSGDGSPKLDLDKTYCPRRRCGQTFGFELGL